MENLVNGKKVKMSLAAQVIGAFVKAAQQEDWTTEEMGIVIDALMSAKNYDELLHILMVHTE
jgi:hypothetical protein